MVAVMCHYATDELRAEKINECTEPLWKTTPIKIDNLYIKLYTDQKNNEM